MSISERQILRNLRDKYQALLRGTFEPAEVNRLKDRINIYNYLLDNCDEIEPDEGSPRTDRQD
jgi:hypothetical protein